MRLVHTADWHLAYRSGTRVTPTGINQREADVARTFTRMIDQIIALAPDVVVAAGDLFDRVNPGNAAIVHAHVQLARLRAALPSTIVVLISGNHESPRQSADNCILPLFATLGIHVVDRGAPRLRFGDLSILAVPDVPGLARPALVPDPDARFNVLLLHGEVAGMPGGHAKNEISRDALGADRWDYVALGHYHVAQEIAANCWYSGSIDLTSSNPWSELATPKGFIERDLETGAHTFHELPASRRYLDLAPIDATGLGADEVDALIRAAVDAASIDDAVVRLRVDHITQEVGRALNQKAIREYKARALNFHLDERRADRVRPESIALVRQMGQTIAQRVEEKLLTTDLPNDVDRAALVDLGKAYLEQATERAGDRLTNEPVPLISDAAPTRKTA